MTLIYFRTAVIYFEYRYATVQIWPNSDACKPFVEETLRKADNDQ
jgi:hypothetical protein